MPDDAIQRPSAAFEGRHRIVREVGEGGMTIVYLADDLGQKHALKVLKLEPTAVVGRDR